MKEKASVTSVPSAVVVAPSLSVSSSAPSPSASNLAHRREELERLKKLAIQNEDYEKAQTYKEQIEEIDRQVKGPTPTYLYHSVV
jgi:hypothetical protein